MHTNATENLANGLVRAARDGDVLLNSSSKGRVDHSKGKLASFLALGEVVLKKVLQIQYDVLTRTHLGKSRGSRKRTLRSLVSSCSVIALMFSRALSADSKGEKAESLTTLWKREKS